MRRFIVSTALAVIMAGPAWATNPPPAPPSNNGGGPTTNNVAADARAAALAAALAKANATAAATGGAAQGGAGGAATANGGNQTNGQTVNNNGAGANSNNYTQAGIPVATSTAPSFAIGQCQWAISGGAQFFGFGGSAGGAGLYEFCKAMMKADHFRKLGREDLAKVVECNDAEFRAAYRDAGTPCRADVPKDQQAVTPIVQPVGWMPPASATTPGVTAAAVVPLSRQPQCFDSAGRPVALGTPGAVRCN